MPLKFNITDLFVGKFCNPQNIYEQFKDLDRQIQDGADAKPIVKNNVKLTKKDLKKAFDDPKKMDYIGIIHNEEGSYLVVSDNKDFKIISLENI